MGQTPLRPERPPDHELKNFLLRYPLLHRLQLWRYDGERLHLSMAAFLIQKFLRRQKIADVNRK